MNTPASALPDLRDPREPLQGASADTDNPLGLAGIEFIEYVTPRPQALGQVLEMMGWRPVARHRSREVTLYRQGGLNIVVNAHGADAAALGATGEAPAIAAVALRVRDARHAFSLAVARGGWAVPPRAEVMELNIPAIHGAGGSRLYFVDRWREFSIYDVDFIPIPSVDAHPPALPGLPGLHFFGIVQYIGLDRTADWEAFYETLFGMQRIPAAERFGILPRGSLLRAPALEPAQRFLVQLVEPEPDAADADERLHRIGLGVPDVMAAVAQLRRQGIEFVETPATHSGTRGAVTRTYLGSVTFELVHSEPVQRP